MDKYPQERLDYKSRIKDYRPATRVNKADNASQPTEQPNTNTMIIKTIQGLLTCINNELDKLNEGISVLEHCTELRPKLVAKALEEIDLFEKTTLFELQKAFE